MRGISKDRLIDIFACYSLESAERIILQECRELQEPWMTLDEFVKSGFTGLCWVAVRSGSVYPAMKIGSKFIDDLSLGTHIYHINITNVMPIHKPEPPI